MIAHQIQQDEVTKTFYEIEKLLWNLVHRFVEQNGGDRDELFSIASEAFLRAYKCYDRDRGTFSTYLTRCVKNAIWRVHKRDLQRRSRETLSGDCNNFISYEFNRFSLSNYSYDVQKIMVLVIESPPETKRNIIKKAIRRHLRSVGWTLKRITETFNEVRKVLR